MVDVTTAYLAEDESGGVFPAVIAGTVLAFLAILLRLTSRFYAKTNFWWDDWTIFVAFVFEIGVSAGILYADLRLHTGRHIQVLSDEEAVSLSKNLIAVQLIYFTTQMLIKISLLLLYYRMFAVHRRFRITTYATAAVILAWWISCLFPTLFACVPVHAFWIPTVPDKRCINLRIFGIANGTFNMLTDILVLALPVPLVWSLQLALKRKLLLLGAFLVGAFVCIISIVRLSRFPGFDIADPSFGLARIYLWTSLESCCAIVASCLPTLGPLLVGVLGLQPSQAFASNKTGGRSSTRHTTDSGPVAKPPQQRNSAASKFYPLGDDEILSDAHGGMSSEENLWRPRETVSDVRTKVTSSQRKGEGAGAAYPMAVFKETTIWQEETNL